MSNWIAASGRGPGTWWKKMAGGLGLTWLLMAGAVWCDDDMAREADFHISPQPLPAALIAFSDQSGVQVMTDGQNLAKLSTGGVSGHYSIGEALQRLLDGTGLGFSPIGHHTIAITSGMAVTGPPGTVEQAEAASDMQSSAPSVGTDQPTENGNEAAGEKKQLAELKGVEVTGSRLPRTAKEGPQDIKVYSKTEINQSGQTSVSDFLNTLPDVSVNSGEQGYRTLGGATTVQLHGLPIGTTLVLINGRRVSPSADQAQAVNFFDLSNIPLSAVERVEVVSTGSSAVYGSDAIAGVVNIILRKQFNGVEADLKYGGAAGTNEKNASLAFGKIWSKGSLSVIATFRDRSELPEVDRSITSNGDYTSYGGIDTRLDLCSFADVYSTNGGNLPGTNSPYAAVSPGSTAQNYLSTPGTLNACTLPDTYGVFPTSRSEGVFAQGSYDLSSSISAFTELLYSHTQLFSPIQTPPLIFGEPGYQQFTVSASNPFNPYGQTVGISQLLYGTGSTSDAPLDTEFFRPLVGLKGNIQDKWQWEIAGWEAGNREYISQNGQLNTVAAQAAFNSSNPSTALDPFTAGPDGSTALLQSIITSYRTSYLGQTKAVSGYIRGPLATVTSGSIDAVMGAEYDHDTYFSRNISDPYAPPGDTLYGRQNFAIFGESRIPIIANHANSQSGDILAASIAGRYDHFSDFGEKLTPQFGGEWRPTESFLIRATYGRAFKAPSLYDLYQPVTSMPAVITDPELGNQPEAVAELQGGNRNLRPETGQSRTFGFVYSSKVVPNLQFSVTHWGINESNSIQSFGAQSIVDDPSQFPGDVIRAPTCSSGPPCPITQVNTTFVNFGEIDVSGIDYQVSYKYLTDFGQFTPSLSASEIYHYTEALTPNTAPIDATSKAQDSGNWAPRWKATAALGWKVNHYAATVDGRYVGTYQDYDSFRNIGNFWIYDANVRYSIGEAFAADSRFLKGLFLELGGVNLLNTLPQYSNYLDGGVGYDPNQSDIRGRFLYAKLGTTVK